MTSGNLGVAGTRGYRNGTAEGSAIGVLTGTWVRSVYIGADNYSAGQHFCAVYIQSFVIYNTTPSQAQITALTTAMAAL
jgi:hypothetical protein